MSQVCTILCSFSLHCTLLSEESKLCILAASQALMELHQRCPDSRTGLLHAHVSAAGL